MIRIWIAFSVVGQISSLASLLDDVIAWNAFIADVITAYRAIVDFIWGSLFELFRFNAPQWIHDYLTLSSLMAVSVFWALHSTSQTFQWGGLGSVFGVIRNSLFDLRVGGNALELFDTRTRRAAASAGIDITEADAAIIDHLARPSGRTGQFLWAIFGVTFLVVSLVVLPVLIPVFLRRDDARSTNLTIRLFIRRKRELEKSGLMADLKKLAITEIDSRISDARSRQSMYNAYHNEISRQILYYYLAVFVLFGILVLANYFFQNISEAAKSSIDRTAGNTDY